MGFTFDPSISVGNLVTITFGCIALVMAWGKLGSRLDMMEFRVKAVEDTLKIMAEAIKSIATAQSDIALMRAQVIAIETDLATTNRILERLRSGHGWIQSRGGNVGVDREYP